MRLKGEGESRQWSAAACAAAAVADAAAGAADVQWQVERDSALVGTAVAASACAPGGPYLFLCPANSLPFLFVLLVLLLQQNSAAS